MPGLINQYLCDDHRRLEGYLENIIKVDGSIDTEAYNLFRGGILRHIAIEEKVLVSRLRKKGKVSGFEDRLREDHGAIAALLVPVPGRAVVRTIKKILKEHNNIEEKEGGFYDWCDMVLAGEIRDVEREMKSMPVPELLPNLPYKKVFKSTLRVLKRAGYEMEDE